MALEILDHVHDPGRPGGVNEDAWGHAGDFAWVFDGATGLGDEPLTDGPSDAAWLVRAGSEALRARAPSHRGPLPALVDEVIDDVARRFEREARRAPVARYERPTAALILVHQRGASLECLNFGDCKLLLRHGDGRFESFGSNPDNEAYESHLAARFSQQRREAGAQGRPEQHREHVLARLRKARNRHNVPGGYWVFGLDPAAAEHARVASLHLEGPATGLLISDGFEALAGDYGRYSEAGLVDAALEKGLASLLDELRHIERVRDPDAHKFPRFKQSDDATAVLFRAG